MSWLDQIEARIASVATADDPAHDFLHFKRVVSMAHRLALAEGASLDVVIPAAWLHDLVIVPKNDPRRSQASRLSAQAAREFLREINYLPEFFDDIAHAIEAHSFSAAIECRTLEARIVQDADRLDALGAIGIARCFATAGLMKRAFYSDFDPFCDKREADDSLFTIDHFYKKLYRIAETLKTESGRSEGRKRVEAMKQFMASLAEEIA